MDDDEFFGLFRKNDMQGFHDRLDSLPADIADEKVRVSLWRVSALMTEGRYQEALDFLQESDEHFPCKTLVYHQRAKIYQRIGQGQGSAGHMETAPFASELDRYWPLVMDAKFYRLYLMAEQKRRIDPALLDEIPDDFMYIMLEGNRISKADLERVIDA